MFTALAIIATIAIGYYATRKNREDQAQPPGFFEDGRIRQSIVHAREDLKLIAFLLAGILVMLGVIADRAN